MTVSLQPEPASFGYIQEGDDEFLKLFPHRWNYLYAKYPELGESPKWHSEGRYPLSDRHIQQGNYLYGVRFSPQTNYLVADLDPTSQYHPKHDLFAVARLMAALEVIGLVAYVAVQSSYRSGIHLYFPFEEAQSSWVIALVVQTLLENAGFLIRAGQLEIFPNARGFIEGTPTLYNGHRLPLQAGSHILNQDWEPTYSTQATFVANWKFARRRNALDLRTIESVRQRAQRKQFGTSTNAKKFLNDLNDEIEPGWTGSGQTNCILGKIACRERVFHHFLHGGEPLAGKALVEVIAQVARSLPGYLEFCGHQHEIEERAKEYARAAEKRYYPFGSRKSLQKEVKDSHATELTWNQRQAQAARVRIREAIANILNEGNLPTQITDRFEVLKSYGIGSDTLSKNRDLWDPRVLQAPSQAEFPPTETKSTTLEALESSQDKEFPPAEANKFAGMAGLDAPQEQSKPAPLLILGGLGGFPQAQTFLSL